MAKLIEQVSKNGQLDIHPAINDAKLVAADKILEGVRRGEHAAVSEFKFHMGSRFGEAIHTTGDDFIFAFAALTAFEVDNEWQAAERTWTEVIDVQTVTSFEAPKVYSINPITEGYARPQTEPNKPAHIVPKVPEGSPYPHFKFAGELAASGGIFKAGGQYDLTFEQIVNDVAGIVPLIPQLITESLLEREEYDAWGGLVDFIDIPANHLQAGTALDGTTATVADAPLSRNAIIVALEQAKNREIIPGRKVNVSSYRLIVPRGVGERANFLINSIRPTGFTVTDGSVATDWVSNYNPLQALSGVTETDYLTGTQWAIVPSKGAVRGNKKFYNLGRLRGHEGPELRLEDATGVYLGGGKVPPFEGSYKTDSASFRGRIIDGGLGWNPEYAVISDGDGA